ncbi:MAG TPA: hypothetical protein VF657_10385, partial [Actinoplanes sp.]
MRRLAVSGAVLSLLLITGCNNADTGAAVGSGAAEKPQSAADPQDTDSPEAQLDAASIKAENMVADCMKKKGFQ